MSDFYTETRGAAKVIVVDLGFLGDTVHLLPALWEIKDHYPQAVLHVLSSPLGCEVLKLVKCVDKAWAFPLGPPSPKWWQHWGLIHELRRERFDVAFNFSGADRTVLVTAAIRARRSLAYQGARKHFWQPWVIRDWIPKRDLPTPTSEGRRQLLKLAGFDSKPARFDLAIPPAEIERARQMVPSGSAHISLSASSPLKEWPMRNSVEFARKLLTDLPELTIVATGAPNQREQERLRIFESELANSRVKIVSEPLSVAALAAVLHQCSVHVGPDSGVLHLAAALGVPTVAIFRQYPDMKDWLPVGLMHAHFEAACPCMELKMPPCSRSGEAACLAGISSEAVATHVFRLLKMDPTKEPQPVDDRGGRIKSGQRAAD